MSAEIRKFAMVLAVIIPFVVVYAVGRELIQHAERMESAARAQADAAKKCADELKRKRENEFSESCKALGGWQPFTCPGFCIERNAVLKVMP